MRAMLLSGISDLREVSEPLTLSEVPVPTIAGNEVLIRIHTCGVCHTELDEIEGRTPPPHFPVIPGHQVVGRIERSGQDVSKFSVGDRVGVAWIHSACGTCEQCRKGLPNLCGRFAATGRDRNGGYAEYIGAPESSVYPIPDIFTDEEAAPLLCAGAIGYRSLKLTQLTNGQNLGLSGFGASGHQVMKMALSLYPDSSVYVFARSGKERAFALELGAAWSGDTSEKPPEKLQAIIDTTPVWTPVVEALKHLESGGRLVINAIRKEEVDKEVLLDLSYHDQLWMEKEIKSVANITPRDVSEFLELAARIKLKPELQVYYLEDANQALLDLKRGGVRGAKVLRISDSSPPSNSLTIHSHPLT